MTDIPVPFNDRRVSYTAAGGETSFVTDFPIQAQTDLSVARTRTGSTTTLTLTTDYTVSIADATGIATITPVAAVLAADIWVLSGDTVIERTTDFQQRGPWLAQDINDEFDRIVMMLQEFSRDESGFVIRVNEAATWVIGTVDGTPTANQFLRRNSANTGWEFATVVTGGSVVSATETQEGIREISTTLEATTGVNDITFMTPAKTKSAIEAVAHTFTQAQTIQPTAGGTSTLLTMNGTDDGAASGPFFVVKRSSATPAANDFIGGNFYQAKDSGGNDTSYAFFQAQILDPTDGSEDGRMALGALVAGAFTNVITYGPGVQIGSPTGGDQGAGTLNLDGKLYRDGTQLLDTRVTGWTAATNTKSKATFDTTTVTLPNLAARVGQIIDDLIAHGIIGA